MNKIYQEIANTVEKEGICKSHVSEILNEKQLEVFHQVQEVYQDVVNRDYVKDRFSRISSGNPIKDRSKWYEVTQFELLKRGLGVHDSLVQLYLQQPFIDIAKLFYGELPKIRNVLMWAHPQNANKNIINSQDWHRDQEDWKIFKVFINFSDIALNNGATEYCNRTQHGGEKGNPQDFLENNRGGSRFVPSKDLKISNASGPIGTISFINTNGLHKGGLVNEGIRLLTQCNYLKPTAVLLNNDTLPKFGYNNKINVVDYESQEYLSLPDEQRFLVS